MLLHKHDMIKLCYLTKPFQTCVNSSVFLIYCANFTTKIHDFLCLHSTSLLGIEARWGVVRFFNKYIFFKSTNHFSLKAKNICFFLLLFLSCKKTQSLLNSKNILINKKLLKLLFFIVNMAHKFIINNVKCCLFFSTYK